MMGRMVSTEAPRLAIPKPSLARMRSADEEESEVAAIEMVVTAFEQPKKWGAIKGRCSDLVDADKARKAQEEKSAQKREQHAEAEQHIQQDHLPSNPCCWP